MTIDITVEAEPASLDRLGQWLKSASRRVEGCASGTNQAGLSSREGWEGRTGEGFRHVMTRVRDGGDELAQEYYQLATRLEEFASAISAVRDNMDDAREHGVDGGLTCTDSEIHPPGDPPPQPRPLVFDPPAVSWEEHQQNRAAWATWNEWVAKARTYAQCSTLVLEARAKEDEADDAMLDVAEAIGQRWPIAATDFITGLSADYIARQNTWQANAASLRDTAEAHRHAATDASRGARAQSNSLVQAMVADSRARATELRTQHSRIGGWLNNLPEGAKAIITRDVRSFAPKHAPFLEKAPAMIKEVRLSGGVLAAGAVAWDISEGKDPGTSIMAGAGGLITGAGTAAMFSNPWTAAAASLIVGTGTSIGIHELGPDAEDEMIIAPGRDPETGSMDLGGH